MYIYGIVTILLLCEHLIVRSFILYCNIYILTNSLIYMCTHLEFCSQGLQSNNVRILQHRVGGNRVEHFQNLVESSLERVKLPKNVLLTEVELSF